MVRHHRMQESNIFPAAGSSWQMGFVAPTDEKFPVIDADDDRLPPTGQIILLVKACCDNQRPGLELLPETGRNRRRCSPLVLVSAESLHLPLRP
jgi:hypothetical protein